jgi:hypothetical protein
LSSRSVGEQIHSRLNIKAEENNFLTKEKNSPKIGTKKRMLTIKIKMI